MDKFLFHLSSKEPDQLALSTTQRCLSLPSISIFFIEAGSGTCRIGGKKVLVSAGDILLIAPNEVCDFSQLPEVKVWVLSFHTERLSNAGIDVKGLSMLLTEEPLQSLLTDSRCRYSPVERQFKGDSARQVRWSSCLYQLERELLEKPFGYGDVACSLLKLMLFDVVRLLRQRFPASSHQPLVSKALRFIEDNYKRSISLSDVAIAVERSPAYLTDLVRKATGKTVLCWIVEHRMAYARQLLLYTSRSVSDISEQVGYFDRRHFSRQFFRVHQLTPQKWRDRYYEGSAIATRQA